MNSGPGLLLLIQTLATPEENLAFDEALAVLCEEEGVESLRFWEPKNYFVVIGYANKIKQETLLENCRARNISVLRRVSGGGTVLQGPGCLNFALALRVPDHGPLVSIPESNQFILKRNARAFIEKCGLAVAVAGQTDLAIEGKKFSGNAQRRFRRSLLFHGTFLLNFDLDIMDEFLPMPSRQPAYRQNRSHRDFLMNLGISSETVQRLLAEAWNAVAHTSRSCHPDSLTKRLPDIVRRLVQEKYGRPEWNEKW